MAFGDLTRINTNLLSLQTLYEIQKSNSELSTRQLRLATGKRINSAEEDSTGKAIATKLNAQIRGQAQALANIGSAKSALGIAEGSLDTIAEILMTMKEKAIQGANDTLSSTERTAINTSLEVLATEVSSAISAATFNDVSLFTSTAFNFQVGPSDASGDSISVSVGTLSRAGLGISSTSLNVSSVASATLLQGNLDTAIDLIASTQGSIADGQVQLSFKEENLNVNMINQTAARSRIEDADFAKEQIEIVKLQILQQTGLASLTQSQLNSQFVLNLL